MNNAVSNWNGGRHRKASHAATNWWTSLRGWWRWLWGRLWRLGRLGAELSATVVGIHALVQWVLEVTG